MATSISPAFPTIEDLAFGKTATDKGLAICKRESCVNAVFVDNKFVRKL
jgi:hypothetical protein